MHRLTLPMALSCFLLATPAQAFFDEIVVGMTSVSNNLIHSGESVTKHSISTTSTTVLVLSHDIGKMADKIGLMADRIGVMADRIVLTESMMAKFAHKVVDTGAAAAKPAEVVPLACGLDTTDEASPIC